MSQGSKSYCTVSGSGEMQTAGIWRGSVFINTPFLRYLLIFVMFASVCSSTGYVSQKSEHRRCTPPLLVVISQGSSGSSMLENIISENFKFRSFIGLREFFGGNQEQEASCCSGSLFLDGRPRKDEIIKKYEHIIRKIHWDGIDDALDIFNAFFLDAEFGMKPTLIQLKSNLYGNSDISVYDALPQFHRFVKWLQIKAKSNDAVIIYNRRNALDVQLSRERHEYYSNLPWGAGCTKLSKLNRSQKLLCWKSKNGKMHVEAKLFSDNVNSTQRREAGIQHFLSNHRLHYHFTTYENLTSTDDTVRTNSWCHIEMYLKKHFCQSDCAKGYLGDSLHCADLSWCTSFAADFKSATPLRNHSEIILNIREVFLSLSSETSGELWRGPKP